MRASMLLFTNRASPNFLYFFLSFTKRAFFSFFRCIWTIQQVILQVNRLYQTIPLLIIIFLPYGGFSPYLRSSSSWDCIFQSLWLRGISTPCLSRSL